MSEHRALVALEVQALDLSMLACGPANCIAHLGLYTKLPPKGSPSCGSGQVVLIAQHLFGVLFSALPVFVQNRISTVSKL